MVLSGEQIQQFCSETNYNQEVFTKIQNKLFQECYIFKKNSNFQSEDNIVKQYVLGQGEQSFVFLGQDVKQKQDVAIKFFKSNKQQYDKMIKELNRIQQSINFDQVVEIYQIFFLEDENICIQILELCSKSLFQEIDEIRRNNQQYSSEQVHYILLFAINVLCQIHAYDIIHFNIQPSKIMITKEGNYKLAGFCCQKSDVKVNQGATELFFSPEQSQANLNNQGFNGQQITSLTDIFSIGICILEVIGVQIDLQILNQIQQNLLESVDTKIKLQYKNIYTFIKYFMIQKQPKQRFSALTLRQIFLEWFESDYNFEEKEMKRLQKIIDRYEQGNSQYINKKYLAYLYYFQSQVLQPKLAEQQILKSLEIVKDLNLKDSLEEFIFLQSYGQILMKLSMFSQSQSYSNKSHNLLIQYYPDSKSIEIGFSYYQLYVLSYTSFYIEECLSFCQKGLEIFEHNFQEKLHPFISSFLNGLGNTYFNNDDVEKCEEYYNKSFEMRKQLYQGLHPSLSSSLNNLARLYAIQGNYYKSLEYFKKSLQIEQALNRKNHLNFTKTLVNIGVLYESLQNPIKELKYFKRALEMTQAIVQGNHPLLAVIYGNLGDFYKRKRDYNKYLEYYKQALDMAESLYVGNHSFKIRFLRNIGEAYNLLVQQDIANQFIQRAHIMQSELKQ